MSASGRPAAAVRMIRPAREAVLLAELPHDRAQAAALGAIVDLARDAHVIDGGHEHQKAARNGDVRREAGALGAERLLRDLDDDFLALVEELLDLSLVALGFLGGVGASRAVLVGIRSPSCPLAAAPPARPAAPGRDVETSARGGRAAAASGARRRLVLLVTYSSCSNASSVSTTSDT